MATICAGLIVRNVERVLPRCLASLKGVVDGLFVVDTGSTDGTLELVQRARVDFPRVDFEVFTGASDKDASGTWRLWDFSAARNRFVEGIERLGYDFILWVDADDELISPGIKDLARDTAVDAHGVQIRADTEWTQHRLWRTGLGIRFSGRCHEYPDLDRVRVKNHADILILHHGNTDPQESSLQRNLRILERELREDPSSRCAFYLGNTYRELGQMTEAVEAYQQRLNFGLGYADEFYFALLYQGRCRQTLGLDDRARSAFLRGAAERPGWSEFWMALANLEYGLGHMRQALGYCFIAMERPIPPTLLWREKEAYLEQPAALAADIYGNRRLAQASEEPQATGPITVYLGLGANQGDRRGFIDAAVTALSTYAVLSDQHLSPLYETNAVTDDPQPPYLNAVVRGETTLSAEALLAGCLEIEAALGRVRTPGRTHAPRTIDIDLLLFGGAIIDTPALKVPHPAMMARGFVLAPLAQVATPGLVHPVTGAALTAATPFPGVRLAPISRPRASEPAPDPASLAILVPVLHRPGNVAPLVESFLAACPAGAELVFVASRGDQVEIDAIRALPEQHPGGRRITLLTAPEGSDTWARKINLALGRITADWYLLGADDIRFHAGWWEATATLRRDGRFGVIGTNDLGNPKVMIGDHAVHPLVARRYADLGAVDDQSALVHTGYHHWCCDDELVTTAKERGAWAPCLESIVEHLHPYWSKGQADETYVLGVSRAPEDQELWARRARRFFGLTVE